MSLNTVTVGCKLPLGHIMHLTEKGGTGRREVRLRGTALRPGQTKPFIVAGDQRSTKADDGEQTYFHGATALTQVDAEFWAEWYRLYKDSPPVKAGFIFSHDKGAESVTAIAKERQSLLSGMEPIDPAKPAPDVKPFKQED